MTHIILNFDKTLSNLAGYEFGLSVYNEQVKGKIDLSDEFIFEFPEQIKGVASSFVQGFFADIVKQIGLLATEERTHIISPNERITTSLLQKLQ